MIINCMSLKHCLTLSIENEVEVEVETNLIPNLSLNLNKTISQ